MAVPAVTQMELLFGAKRSSNPARNTADVEGLLAHLDLLAFDGDAAAQTAQTRAQLARLGTPIVITNNVRAFQRAPRLRVENRVSAS